MSTTEHKIAVMQAYVAGKDIELRSGSNREWRRTISPTWNWKMYDYRVRPEISSAPYRRYVRDSQNVMGGPVNRLCHLLYKSGPDYTQVEKLPGFVRWIDTEWQLP